MMVLVVALVASLLVVAESQVSDMAARANLKGFLSKYIEDLSAYSTIADASKTSLSNPKKFITPSVNHMKHGNGPEALSHHNHLAEHYFVGGGAASNTVDKPFIVLDDKPLHPTSQSPNSLPMAIANDHGTLKAVDRKTENLELDKMLASPKANADLGLMAIAMTLLACVAALAVRCRRERQPALVLAVGAEHGSDILPASSDHPLELKSQASTVRGEAERWQRLDASIEEVEAQHFATPHQEDIDSSPSDLRDTVVFSVAPVAAPGAQTLQTDINGLLAPYGAPALGVPSEIAAAVDAKCFELEQSTAKPPLEALQGAWRVVYSNAPSPSNGALGPLRGDGLQIVDVAKRRYTNELRLFGGNARVALEATFTGDAEELRVAFKSIKLVLFGNKVLEKDFPPGVERTWCLSYTDASCRVVRAGVDGGRSLVREAGLVDKSAGEAKDAYLFFMERAEDYVAD